MRRGRERGAMILIMAGAMLTLAVIGIVALTLMRIVLAKQETQRVADSACLAAATIIKTQGLPLQDKEDEARNVAYANHPGMHFDILFPEPTVTRDQVALTCQAATTVQVPALIWAGGQFQVTASASASVAQTTLDDATKKYPRLVLVLDYSGSMLSPLWKQRSDPHAPSSVDILMQEVDKLLAKNYNIKLGLVIFASEVLDSVAIALNNTQKVSSEVHKPLDCPAGDDGGGCSTNSSSALNKAHKLFGPWDYDEERYVLFISDGAPNLGGGIPQAEKEAQGLFQDAHANIITLQLINYDPNADSTLQTFMQTISGSPDHNPDPCYYFNADSQDSLNAVLQAIGNAIACPLKLDQALPPNTAVHVFLSNGGGEEALGDASQIPLCSGAPSCGQTVGSKFATLPGDLADETNCTYYQGDYFLYYAPKQSIYVTPNVCDRILNDHSTMIVRTARPVLTQ
jgi:hypothetical protein